METPHTIDFDSGFRYAAIASTSAGTTRIVSVDDRAIDADFETESFAIGREFVLSERGGQRTRGFDRGQLQRK